MSRERIPKVTWNGWQYGQPIYNKDREVAFVSSSSLCNLQCILFIRIPKLSLDFPKLKALILPLAGGFQNRGGGSSLQGGDEFG